MAIIFIIRKELTFNSYEPGYLGNIYREKGSLGWKLCTYSGPCYSETCLNEIRCMRGREEGMEGVKSKEVMVTLKF